MIRIGNGDRVAFGELVRRHLSRAVAVAQRVTGSRGDAEEIAQEAFLRVWTKAPQLAHRRRRVPRRPLHHLALSRRRQSRHRPQAPPGHERARGRRRPRRSRGIRAPQDGEGAALARASPRRSPPCRSASAPPSRSASTKASATARPPISWRSRRAPSNPCWCARAARCAKRSPAWPPNSWRCHHDDLAFPPPDRRLRRRPRPLAARAAGEGGGPAGALDHGPRPAGRGPGLRRAADDGCQAARRRATGGRDHRAHDRRAAGTRAGRSPRRGRLPSSGRCPDCGRRPSGWRRRPCSVFVIGWTDLLPGNFGGGETIDLADLVDGGVDDGESLL